MHRFASLVAVMAFLFILTGALVSGSSNTPAVLAWTISAPLKYASAYGWVAAALAVFTVVLTWWLWSSGSEPYIKRLAGVALSALLASALVAALAAPRLSVGAASLLYALLVQTFFALAVCLALFTRTDWRWDHDKISDLAAPSLRQVLVFLTGALFLQTLFGEAYHLGRVGLAPHLVLGIVVTLCGVWVLEMALSKFPHLAPFKLAAILLGELVGLQLFLGIIAYSLQLEARGVPGAHPGVLVMNVTHAAVGALVLATSLFVTFQAFKYLASPQSKAAAASQLREREGSES